ncbi:hypothetical protein GDO78_018865 [Eleutherodactylus coqui]|uniref:Uncharacterized protein n=1 Tax=Eleutherodactylus coqui TaxID=57060 RepID=A0A8J6E6M4_ELECQ|nr:hypothetical protein GDO78_018865 [Eleutherodactylus coqui]
MNCKLPDMYATGTSVVRCLNVSLTTERDCITDHRIQTLIGHQIKHGDFTDQKTLDAKCTSDHLIPNNNINCIAYHRTPVV